MQYPVKYWVVRCWGDKWVHLRQWPACVTDCCLVSQKPGGDKKKHSLFAAEGKGGRMYLKVGRFVHLAKNRNRGCEINGADWQAIDLASALFVGTARVPVDENTKEA